MAALCEKSGDLQGARSYKLSAQALQTPEQLQVPLQSQLNQAHKHARTVEKKLNSAIDRYEQLEQQLAAQQPHVLQLRSELAAAEAEHSGLARQLHNQLPDGQPQPAAGNLGNKLSLEDLLDEQRFSAAFDLDVGDCFEVDEVDESLTPEEQQQLSSRVEQFKSGITGLAKKLFSEAKAKVDELRAEHKQLAARMAAKKRRTGEQGQGVAGGGAPPVQGAAAKPDDGSAPAGAEAAAPEAPATAAASASGPTTAASTPPRPSALARADRIAAKSSEAVPPGGTA